MGLFTSLLETLADLLLVKRRIIRGLGTDDAYLTRYYIFGAPRMPDGSSPFDDGGALRKGAIEADSPGLYLHHFHRSDQEPEVHNHPFTQSVSLVLAGGYQEERRVGGNDREVNFVRPGDLNWIGHDTFHRVVLDRGPAWSLFAVSRKTHEWGFLDRRGNYTEYRDFFARRAALRASITHCPMCKRMRHKDDVSALLPPEDTWDSSTKACGPCDVCRHSEEQRRAAEELQGAGVMTFAEWMLNSSESDYLAFAVGEPSEGHSVLQARGHVAEDYELLFECAMRFPDSVPHEEGDRYMWVTRVTHPTSPEAMDIYENYRDENLIVVSEPTEQDLHAVDQALGAMYANILALTVDMGCIVVFHAQQSSGVGT